MSRTKQKRQFYFLAIAVLALAVILAMYSFVLQTQQDINQQDKQYLSEIAHQNAATIQKIVDLNFDKLEAVGELIGSEQTLTDEGILASLTVETQRFDYKRMGFASLSGQAVTTDNRTFDISDREYFHEAIENGRGISDKLVDKTDGQEIIVYAVPIYRAGAVYGVIFATCTMDEFTELLSTPLFGNNGYLYVITDTGAPVVSEESSAETAEFANLFEGAAAQSDAAAMQRNMQDGRNGTLDYRAGGKEKVAAYSKVGINRWYVVSVVPKEVITQNTSRVVARNIVVSVSVTVIFVLLLLLLAGQQKRTTRRLERIAYFDELTGYPNYAAFLEKAAEILNENPDRRFVFVMLDVEEFKLINDRLGFETGNRVLKNIAQAIADSLQGPKETFARVYIDEFIILREYKSEEYIRQTRETFERRFWERMGADFYFYTKFPTGRYITDQGETNLTEICEKANYAHRQANQSNRKTGVCEFFYDSAEKEKALHRLDIENRMTAGIANREFKVLLQPKYRLSDHTIAGAEALVRWQTADGTALLPGEFIPVFEQNGFVVQLDLYMLKETCALLKAWIGAGLPVVPVSVNFSRLHLTNPDFIRQVTQITDAYGVPRKYIELELTESVIFENESRIESVLQQAHEAGFLLSMDDFGSGYSSLGLLKNIPVDIIKIDRSFFVDSRDDQRTKTVLSVMMVMAKKLNAKTVAEGVEDADLVTFLRQAGCDMVQGFYFAKPMPPGAFAEKLKINLPAEPPTA